MSQSRDAKGGVSIFGKKEGTFGQPQGIAKIKESYAQDRREDKIADLYVLVRESQYNGMITADYGNLQNGAFVTNSQRFALLDVNLDLSLAELKQAPIKEDQINWRTVFGKNVEKATRRLSVIGDAADASQVALEKTSARALSLFPTILAAVCANLKLDLSQDIIIRVIHASWKEGLNNSYYGSAYEAHSEYEDDRGKPFSSFAKPAEAAAAAPLLDSKLSDIKEVKSAVAVGGMFGGRAIAPLEDEIKQFECPISLGIMRDPITASDGQTYEKAELLALFEATAQPVSPITRKKLTETLQNIAESEGSYLIRQQIHKLVLSNLEAAKQFIETHPAAITHPNINLNEEAFAEQFKQTYPELIPGLKLK